MATGEHPVMLEAWQVDELAGLLASLHLWLSDAPRRTLVELADYTDAHWTNAPRSRDDYAARFIARVQRCRAMLDPEIKEDALEHCA